MSKTPPPYPTATFLSDTIARLTFPYSGELVEALKVNIPADLRTYDPDSKAWSVGSANPSWARLAVDLLLHVFPHADVGGTLSPPWPSRI